MKTNRIPAAGKSLIRFDGESKNLAAGDLQSFLKTKQFLLRKKQALEQSTLSVA